MEVADCGKRSCNNYDHKSFLGQALGTQPAQHAQSAPSMTQKKQFKNGNESTRKFLVGAGIDVILVFFVLVEVVVQLFHLHLLRG
jgi:hypothetical protein